MWLFGVSNLGDELWLILGSYLVIQIWTALALLEMRRRGLGSMAVQSAGHAGLGLLATILFQAAGCLIFGLGILGLTLAGLALSDYKKPPDAGLHIS